MCIEHLMRVLLLNLGADSLRAANNALAGRGYDVSTHQSDGLSSDLLGVLFQDREGTIWAGTSDGLDRFRDFAGATFTVKQGLLDENVAFALAARDGSVLRINQRLFI